MLLRAVVCFGPVGLLVLGCGRLGYELLGDGVGDAQRGPEAGASDASTGGNGAGGAGGMGNTDASPSTGGRGPNVEAGLDAPGDAPIDGCRPVPSIDYCLELPALPSAPVIDGVLDCGVELHPLEPQGWVGAGPLPVDISAEYAVAWRPDGLYFFVKVRDPDRVPANIGDVTWFGDGVEFYADDDATYTAPPDQYDATGTRQLVLSAPVDDMSPSTRAEVYAWAVPGYPVDWESESRGAFPTADGYIAEGFVSAADLSLATWSLSEGQRVGMDIGVNVSFPAPVEPPGNNRLGQFFLRWITSPREPFPYPYNNPRAFCSPILAPP